MTYDRWKLRSDLDECPPEPQGYLCEECDGSGFWEVDYRRRPCPTCNGTGLVEDHWICEARDIEDLDVELK